MSFVLPPLHDQPPSPPPASPIGKLSLSGVVGVLLIALVYLYHLSLPIGPSPLWSHLKYGQWILENRRLPDHEPFCHFADQEAKIIDYRWLSQAALQEIYERGEPRGTSNSLGGGVTQLIYGHAILTAVMSLLLWTGFRRISGSNWCAGLGLGLWFVLRCSIANDLGPGTFGEICLAAILWSLSRPTPAWKAVLGIPLWLALWANLDGSFWVGLILLGCGLAGQFVDASRGEKGWRPWRVAVDCGCWRYVLALGLAVAAIAFLNPFGLELFRYTARLLRDSNLMAQPGWQPLDLNRTDIWAWLCLGSLVALGIVQFLSPRCFSPGQVMVLLVMGTAACLQQRNMVWWAQVAPWLLLSHWPAWGQPSEPRKQGLFGPNYVYTTAAAAILVAAGVMPNILASAIRGAKGAPTSATARDLPFPIADTFPNRLLSRLPSPFHELLPDAYESRFQGTIFTSPRHGDYLLWALPADMPVTIYSQVELFSAQHWQDCQSAAQGLIGWWEILDRWRVNLVVVEVPGYEPLCEKLRLDAAWLIVSDEETNTSLPANERLFVAVRKTPLTP